MSYEERMRRAGLVPIPFPNASSFDSWMLKNCFRCRKESDPDDPIADIPCPLEAGIWQSMITDGLTTEIAARLGVTGDELYMPPCPELEEK